MIKHINGKNTPEESLALMRVLADNTRQEIMMLLAHSNKELCANDIANNFILTRPTVSHHLNLMKRLGVLNSRKDGKEIYYSLNKPYVISLLKSIIKVLEDIK